MYKTCKSRCTNHRSTVRPLVAAMESSCRLSAEQVCSNRRLLLLIASLGPASRRRKLTGAVTTSSPPSATSHAATAPSTTGAGDGSAGSAGRTRPGGITMWAATAGAVWLQSSTRVAFHPLDRPRPRTWATKARSLEAVDSDYDTSSGTTKGRGEWSIDVFTEAV